MDAVATYKVLVLGDSNVGKTCIVHRFCDESYYDTYISTIGVDFKQKIINLDGMPVKLQIWDTAGQERFRTLTTAYYRGAMGILLMYDVTSLESFSNLGYWLQNIHENASPQVAKILVGNKSDAVSLRAVKTEDGIKLAEDVEIPFFEVSCKANVNVEQVFFKLARNIRTQREQQVLGFRSFLDNAYSNYFVACPHIFDVVYPFNLGHLNDVDDLDTFNVTNTSKTHTCTFC